MLKEVTRNSHVWSIVKSGAKAEQWILAAPDIHWDNPKCERETLRRHLDEAVEKGARIILPGDTFCLMQGKYDPRGVKSDVRPEHNVAHYIDAVIESAAEWFRPYQPYIDVVGLGNHETAILKRMETNVVDRFIALLNAGAKTEHRVRAGGYSGWYTMQFQIGQFRTSWTLHYNHGSGGGAPVTHGAIEHNRQSVHIEGADCVVMGHVHRSYEIEYARAMLNHNFEPVTRDLLMVRCSTYKDEYIDGHSGWHIERGGGPRPIGGRFICVNVNKGWSAGKTGNKKARPASVTAYSYRAR